MQLYGIRSMTGLCSDDDCYKTLRQNLLSVTPCSINLQKKTEPNISYPILTEWLLFSDSIIVLLTIVRGALEFLVRCL